MSKFLRGLGSFIGIAGGLLGFVLSLLVVYAIAGGGGVLFALFIFPLTWVLIPFYTLFEFGSWNLLVINYGAGIAYWLLHTLADRLKAGSTAPAVDQILERKQESRPAPERPESTDPSKKSPALAIVLFVAGGLVLAAIVSSLAGPGAPAAGLNPTRTPQPSRTPTKIVPTWTPRAVRLDACVTNETIRIRKGPGTDFEAIGGLVSGTCMTILGRNRDASWVYMASEDDKQGWVAAWLLTIEGNVNSVPVRSGLSSLASSTKVPTSNPLPSATSRGFVFASSTPTVYNPFIRSLCSEMEGQVGEYATCQIERAHCDYLPTVNGQPTFCNDRPYPNHNFQLVVFGQDRSDLDGECLDVSGYLEVYNGRLQILAESRSQVSYCE